MTGTGYRAANQAYNPPMLAEAVCKLEGLTALPEATKASGQIALKL